MDGFQNLVLENTRLESPRLLPEIRLHLAMDDLPLWRMGEDELADMGWSTPFWAFAWAGGQALSRYLMDNPETVAGKRVLDFGAGSGMVAISAVMAGAFDVQASDIDINAAEAMRMNAEANDVWFEISTEDVVGQESQWDLVLVGDVCYDKETADRVIPWVHNLARAGTDVLVGDPGRFYLPQLGLRRIANPAGSRADRR